MTNLASTGSLWDVADYSPPGRRRKPALGAWLAAVALTLLGSAPPARAADPTPLTAEAVIVDSLSDRTFYGSYLPDGEPWTEYYAPDGRSAFAVRGCVYRGKWWAADGRACFSYPELDAGHVSCFAIARDDGGITFAVDGADGRTAVMARVSRIAKGNAEQLPLDAGACVGM